ncbi:MAG: DinB family protein [Acidobacteriota bacterium]|nr:DinB family protein [Acidobacteriota bacterium]
MKKSDINPMPQYFDRYINLVDDVDLSQAFDNSIQQLELLDKSLLTRLDGKRYAPDKWTAKEFIQHIIDWERILTCRSLLFARREGATPQNIDENLLAANMNAERRTIDALVDELKIVRASTKIMFESFDDETLQNTGTNWKYEISVLAMGFAIIGHQIHHLNIITEKYLDKSKYE